jgi:hypothetical protein
LYLKNLKFLYKWQIGLKRKFSKRVKFEFEIHLN